MKLSITTYNIFRDWSVEKLCSELPKAGVEAVEFRLGHKHGVDPAMPKAARADVRAALAAAGLSTCSIATGCSFHSADPEKVQGQVAAAAACIELAADLGAPRIRVFGNNIVPGVHPDDTAVQVGRALRELAPIGERAGVNVLLEMHGDFNDWRLCRKAVSFANHRAVGVVYNCDPKDVVAGSVRTVWHEMKALVRHVHFHDLIADDYPYKELFALLAADGYSGWMSMEVSMPVASDADVVRNLHAQAERFFELRSEALK